MSTVMRAFTIWRLRRQRKRSQRKYHNLIEKAQHGDDSQILMNEAADERADIRDAILHFSSLDLLDKAEDLGLPIPTYAQNRDQWEDGRQDGFIHLKRAAQIQLRQDIRNEQREKWNVMAFVLKEIVTPVIGILGAVMGLLSIIHAFHLK
jgi:hypothetical protein